jgi:UDP-glucuronate decarboxylase
VSNFIVQALQNKPITVYGDGSQYRSFCYVDDMIKGLVSLMDTGNDIIGPVNLGNPNGISIRQLAEEIVKLTSSNSKLIFESLPEDDPKQREPDITFAKEILGWEPLVQLSEGLKATISYFVVMLSKTN